MAEIKDNKAQQQEQEQSLVDQVLSICDTAEKRSGLKRFLKELGDNFKIESLNAAVVSQHIKNTESKLSKQLDEILHHPKFKNLESTWMGIKYLVNKTSFDRPVSIELLDVSKDEVYEDLSDAITQGDSLEKDSEFFSHVWKRYDDVGSHPYTVLVTDYAIDNSERDIMLLDHFSVMSERVQLPVVANVSPKFFGKKTYSEIVGDYNIEGNVNKLAEYRDWRDFRDKERSKMVGLCLARFLGRGPYRPGSANKVDAFDYKEEIGPDVDNNLWCQSSFALAANMLQSFEKWGWSVRLTGMETGGLVNGLPRNEYQEGGQKKQKNPIEISIGGKQELGMSRMGMITLAQIQNTNDGVFFEVASAKRPKEFEDDRKATATEKIVSGLQYTLLITRIGHYLKLRQLRAIGSGMSPVAMKDDLQKWLDKFVARGPLVTEEEISKKPLKNAEVVVEPVTERPGYYRIGATFTPHVNLTGMEIRLKMEAEEQLA